MNLSNYLGRRVEVIIDRPVGSKHPRYGFLYPLNYGYIPGTKAPDGEEIDAYLLDINGPVKKGGGVCVAIIHRIDNNDDKLVVSTRKTVLNEEIEKAVFFQEKWFRHKIIR